jgi:hypothetical protein
MFQSDLSTFLHKRNDILCFVCIIYWCHRTWRKKMYTFIHKMAWKFAKSFTSFWSSAYGVHLFVKTHVVKPDYEAICLYSFSDCGIPTVFKGTANNSATTFNSTVTITCDMGYNITGKSVTTCQSDGTWTSLPTCDPTGTYSRSLIIAKHTALLDGARRLNEGVTLNTCTLEWSE